MSLFCLVSARPEAVTTRLCIAEFFIDGSRGLYEVEIKASSEEPAGRLVQAALSEPRRRTGIPFKHREGLTEIRDSQGEILVCWHRSLKLYGCQAEATEAIFRRHQRTMDYRSQAEAARAAYIQLAGPACDAVAELPRGAPSLICPISMRPARCTNGSRC